MEFEWDEAKREANIEKHGVDFIDAVTMWRGEVLDPIGLRIVDDEVRSTALGIIGEGDLVIAVVYTLRQGRLRLISARRARRNERKSYQDQFGRGN